MALEWGTPTTPPFATTKKFDLAASKDLGGGNSIFTGFQAEYGVEGPGLTEAQLLAHVEVIYNALVAAGWTVTLSQSATSSRSAQEA